MFTIALKSQRVIVFLSIGTQFSSRRPEKAGEPLKEESGLIPEKPSEKVPREGLAERGQRTHPTYPFEAGMEQCGLRAERAPPSRRRHPRGAQRADPAPPLTPSVAGEELRVLVLVGVSSHRKWV